MDSRRYLASILAVAAAALVATGCALQVPVQSDAGTGEFDSNCASCHGRGGKGDGPHALLHKLRVPDLTQLSSRNQGVFPAERVAEIIDGTQVLVIHGSPGMPVWGNKYKLTAVERCKDGQCEPESVVRARVQALTEYIRQMNR